MKRLFILTSLVLALISRGQDAAQYVAYLHGGNEVPPNSSPFTGVGYFKLEGSLLTHFVRLPFTSALYFLPAGAGIYGPAGRGANGSVIFDWPTYQVGVVVPAPGQPFVSGLEIEYVGSETLAPDQLSQLTNGLWYVNIKSTNSPEGELRGQICALRPECDCDGDGVPNKDDLCADTLPGAVIGADGCSIDQLCPCSGPWKDHKEYVKAVRGQAFRFWREGRIGVHERNAIVKQAESSDCGNPPPLC